MKRPLIGRCRSLRKAPTDAEKKLWSVLRNRQLNGVKFRRQFSVEQLILDYYSPEYKLAIEADGGQHFQADVIQYDTLRSKTLEARGIQVLRFSNIEILSNITRVCEIILQEIEKRNPPHLNPLPTGRGSN